MASRSSSKSGRPLLGQGRDTVYKVSEHMKVMNREHDLKLNVVQIVSEATGVGTTLVKKIMKAAEVLVVIRPSPFYAVGIIVNEENSENGMINYLMSLLGYKVFVIPPSTLAVTASHPCKNPVSLHLVLRRMHQKLEHHIHRHRLCAYPSIEIYDGSSVRVIAPLTRQTQYFVPEAISPPKWSWCLNYNKKDGVHTEDEDYDDEEEEEEEEEEGY